MKRRSVSCFLLLAMAMLASNFLFPWLGVNTDYVGSTSTVFASGTTGVMVATDGNVTFNNPSTNVSQLAISRTPDFNGIAWRVFDAEKFKNVSETKEPLYVKFKTAAGVISGVISYLPVLNEGDIVKSPDNPDVYIIKYNGGKQYKRLILSPAVFNSYGHLKWSNLKTTTQAEMDKYVTSDLVQVAGDANIYVLIANGDEGEKRTWDKNMPYDSYSVYQINSVDRDSYVSAGPACLGSSTQSCTITNGTGSQSRACSSGNWSAWGICAPVSCSAGYQISGSACVAILDISKPLVTAVAIPASSSSLTINISSLTATDNVAVTGYALTESLTVPSLSAFSSVKPTSYNFASSGTKTLYIWARDAAGNISNPIGASVSISISCSGSATQSCTITNGTGSQSRTCSSGNWSAWGTCAPVSCSTGYQISGSSCVTSSDTAKPVISAFTIPSSASSLTVPVSSLTVTDNVGVTGYMLTESSSAPSATSSSWSASIPASYIFNSSGSKTLYAWAKDAAGNISSSLNDSVVITLPDTAAPTVAAFTIPSTASSLTVSISTFTASDSVGVTGYLLTESSTAPSSGSAGWAGSVPSSYTFSTAGSKTLYAWAKDAAGNISSSLNDSVVITLPDTAAPVISAISSSVTSGSTTISWITNENAVSAVEYGATASYGQTVASSSYATSHSFTISGLAASTTYHFRVSSTDSSSNNAVSTDHTFTTSASGGSSSTPMSSSAKTIFLHHSTGGVIWNGGVSSYISQYNASHGKTYSVTQQEFPKASPYGWNNYPYDYWNIWVNHAGSSAYLQEPTLEILTQTYDVIVWKHCFPVSSIVSDTGSPNVASSSKSQENYKLQYAALKEKMHQFPNKRFIVWTGAALVQGATNQTGATWARDFSNWVKNTWDEPGDNIFIWDFRDLETGGGLYLLPANAASASDSHPNSTFATAAAPQFAQRIIDVIEGRG